MKKTTKADKKKVETVVAPAPTPPPVVVEEAPRTIDPSSYNFPIGTTYELYNTMHRVLRAYVSDNVEMREVASEGNVTVMMLNSLRRECVANNNFHFIR